MVKSFSFLLDFWPYGFHFVKWSFTLPVKNKNNRINSFEENIIEDVRWLIARSVPEMNIALVMEFLGAFFIGFDIFDFFNDGIGFLTGYFMNGRSVMFICIDQWTFSWF